MPGRAAAYVRRATDAVTATGLAAAVLAGVVVLGAVVLAIVVTRPGDLVEIARDHTAALLVGSALAALAMGLLTRHHARAAPPRIAAGAAPPAACILPPSINGRW